MSGGMSLLDAEETPSRAARSIAAEGWKIADVVRLAQKSELVDEMSGPSC
jgi:hypothetical protein